MGRRKSSKGQTKKAAAPKKYAHNQVLGHVIDRSTVQINNIVNARAAQAEVSAISSRPMNAPVKLKQYPLSSDVNVRRVQLVKFCLVMRSEACEDEDVALNLFVSFMLGADDGFRVAGRDILENKHNLICEEVDQKVMDEFLGGVDEEYKSLFSEDQELDDRYITTLFSLLALVLTKPLYVANFSDWLSARMRGIAAKVGLPSKINLLTKMFPTNEFCRILYDRVPFIWQFRAGVFHLLRSRSSVSGFVGQAATWTLNLLEWCECAHLRTIMHELASKRPELLSLSEFRSELTHLAGSISYLQSLGNDAPFCQLLHDPSSPKPTHSTNFKIMAAVAWRLQEENSGRTSSSSNYQGIRLGEDHRLVAAALKKAQEYDRLMKRSEQTVIRETFGRQNLKRVKEINMHYKAPGEETSDEDESEEESDDNHE